MKCVGWKCSFSLVLVLGAILLAAVPSPRNNARLLRGPFNDSLLLATPETPKALSEN